MRSAVLILSMVIAGEALADPADNVAPHDKRSKYLAAGAVAAMHAAYATWSYFAWYRDANSEDFFVETGGPAFSRSAYAGGVDKFGHAWSNYSLTRATTAVLTAGGWNRLPSSLVSAGLTELAFTLTEIQDGYVFGFDPNDMLANVSGATFGVLMENVPAIDRLFDFRLEYFPSADYRRSFRKTGSVDIGQDYTGQSYILAFHPGGIRALHDNQWTYWSRFVDVAVGFEAKHYSPTPENRDALPRQTLYFGLAFNMQGILKELLPDTRGRRIATGMFEVYSLPYTTFRYAEASRTWDSPPPL